MTDVVRADPFGTPQLSDDELLDQAVEEIFPDGRRPRIDYGPFAQPVFQRAVTAVELEYRRLGTLPTVQEVHDSWPRIPLKTYAELYGFEGFRRVLRRRGIVVDENAGLTQEQATALLVLADPTDRRTTDTKMKAFGLSYQVFQAWMRNPRFKSEYHRRSEENLQDVVPTAINRLVSNIEAGDARSIEYGLAMSGRYSPQQAAVQDAMEVVYAVLEAVQRHVPDKSVLRAIMDDTKIAAKAFDLTHKEH